MDNKIALYLLSDHSIQTLIQLQRFTLGLSLYVYITGAHAGLY